MQNPPYRTAHQVYLPGNERRSIANSYTATQLLAHIRTIMLKLHLIDLLSIYYTIKFARNTNK